MNQIWVRFGPVFTTYISEKGGSKFDPQKWIKMDQNGSK